MTTEPSLLLSTGGGMECAMVGRGGGALPRGRGPIIGGAGLHVLYNNEGGISLSFSLLIFICSARNGFSVLLVQEKSGFSVRLIS